MDHRHDGDFSFLQGRNDIPELVKTASDLEPSLFAYNDGLRSFFPIDTPSNTWFSAAFFEKNAAEIPANVRPEIAKTISDALDFHGVEFGTMTKVAEADDSMIKLASQIIDFEQKHKTVNPRERVAKAKKIMHDIEGMKEHFPSGADIPESLSRYGGSHLHDNWREGVLSRLRIAGSPEARASYNSILTSKETEDTPAETIAELLEFLDKQHGMEQHYDHKIHDPFYSVQSCVPPKRIKIIVLSVGDQHFTGHDIDSLDRRALSEHFSEDAIDGIFNNRHDMQGLPDVVKKVLAEILSR